jgi:hypothetical protein
MRSRPTRARARLCVRLSVFRVFVFASLLFVILFVILFVFVLVFRVLLCVCVFVCLLASLDRLLCFSLLMGRRVQRDRITGRSRTIRWGRPD